MTVLTFESGGTQEEYSGSDGRRRPGVRGRSLQVAMLVAAGLGAATVLHRFTPSLERDAIDAVRRSGGTVTLAQSESQAFASDPDVGTSGPIANLEVFDPRIVRTAMWDTGILGHPESLRSLRAPLDENDLKRLSLFRNLEELNLYGGSISDSALKHLVQLPRLRRLTIHNLGIGDAGIQHICPLPQMRELILSGTSITDLAMKEIGQLNTLTTLEVAGTEITDAGAESIAALKYLEVLDVANTALTDVGLAYLGEFDNLRWLNVDKTAVSANGLQELQRRLPMCQVFPTHLLQMSAAGEVSGRERELKSAIDAGRDAVPAGHDTSR